MFKAQTAGMWQKKLQRYDFDVSVNSNRLTHLRRLKPQTQRGVRGHIQASKAAVTLFNIVFREQDGGDR